MFRVGKNTEKVSVFVESKSIQKFSDPNNDLERLLQYRHEEIFQFIRSPFKLHESHPLSSIDQFKIQYAEENSENIRSIIIGDELSSSGTYTDISFNYRLDETKLFAEYIYEKTRLAQNEFEPVLMLHIYMTIFKTYINSKDTRNIVFLTQDKLLLKNREKFEKKLRKLNIMTLNETMIYLDLFAKNRNLYYVGPHRRVNRGWWYWNSFRTKIKRYHVPARKSPDVVHILEAFASRYTYLLMSIDEIGKQHYFPDDVDFMIPYLYNYFLSLASGIFDNLAIATYQKYNMKFEGDHIPSRISLSKGGEDFIKAIKGENPQLHAHIKKYGQFRKLIYELRELATHREGFRDMGYQDSTGFSFFFVIQKQTQELIRSCGDKRSPYEKFSNWGVFHNDFFIFLEPYRFAVNAAIQLSSFCDQYLGWLGFKEYVNAELAFFNKTRLGF